MRNFALVLSLIGGVVNLLLYWRWRRWPFLALSSLLAVVVSIQLLARDLGRHIQISTASTATHASQLEESTQSVIRSTEPGTKWIHRPRRGCPPGWTEDAQAFQERNGAYQAGCSRQIGPVNGRGQFDYLLPGESHRMTIHLEFGKP